MAQTVKNRVQVDNIVAYTLTKRIAELEEENQKLQKKVRELQTRIDGYYTGLDKEEENTSRIKQIID